MPDADEAAWVATEMDLDRQRARSEGVHLLVGFEELMSRRRRFLVPVLDETLSLRANFTWTFIGSAVYSACQWGMLTVLAKLGSAEMVGQFSLGLAVTAPVIMLANLQLRTVQATDAQGEYAFGSYLGLRLVMTTLALLVIVGVVLVSGYRAGTAWVILAIGLSKAFEAVSDVFYGLCQRHERMDLVASSLMIRGPLSLAMLGIGVYLTGSVLWGTLGLVAAFALVLAGFDVRSGLQILRSTSQPGDTPFGLSGWMAKLRPRWELRTLTRLVWLALPLGVVMMLISLNANIPGYFIEHYLGERQLGIFSAVAYLMIVGNQVVVALGTSVTPRLAKYYVKGDVTAFRTLLLKLVGIGALLGLAGMLASLVAGREILTILYRPEYAEYPSVFLWLMGVAGIKYVASFLGYGMTAARYFQAQMPLFALVTGVTAVVCLWLIPSQGLQGAAMTLMVAATVQAVGSMLIVVHSLQALHQRRTRGGKP
jgi:O-antigen/teichoic acid export membrane protein